MTFWIGFLNDDFQINLECDNVDSIFPSPFVFSCCLIMFDQLFNNINRFVDAHDAISN
jgi:hypothetical protein